MEEVKVEDVRAEAAVAVASTLVDKVHQERKSNAAKIVKYPPPPPFIRAVLLVQAFVRRRAFLRSFGGVGVGDNVDEEILELAPAKPMMSIALNFVRRLKSFRWVNIEREATLVAGLVDAQAANITMRDVSAVVNYYQDKVPSDHLSLNVLQEALARQVIVAKEALQERASKLTTPAAIVEAMEQAIMDFQVPPEREDRVLDQTRLRLKRIVAEAEENIRKMLAESSSTPSIDAVAARFKKDFGPVASVVEEEIKVARIRRVQFLEMELETRWSRPFAGPLPPHSRAARRYELELGKKNPKVLSFATEEARHAATLEADFEVELSDLRAKVRELTKKRMEARARSLIQDFDEKLAEAAAQVQEVLDRAILNIGPENPKVIKRAKELLSPDAHSTLFALQAEHTADQLRAELAVADPSPEAGDRRRGCAMALAALLGQLNRDHPLQAKLRAEFAQDFSEVQVSVDEPPLPPPDEGPEDGPGPAVADGPPTETMKPSETTETTEPEVQAPTDLERAITMNEDPFKLEPTPEETNQTLFEAGVRQYDDDPNLDLPEEEQDLWGAPKGFSELTSINQEVLDPTRKAEEERAKLSFDPDPQNVLLLSSIATEDLSPEMKKKRIEQEKAERARGEQKERTAVLTLEELTMETVKLHTEEVFKLKFVRSIADALQIPKHRVKINGFEHGSVKVLLSILEPSGEEEDDEEGRSTMSADRALQELSDQVDDPNSRLRLGEVGPFVVAAHLDRDVIKSDKVNVGSMADAYLASGLEGEDFELPRDAAPSISLTAESASVQDSDEADPDQLIKRAQGSVGTRWGSSRMEHGSLQAESHFRSTCPHSKEDGTLAAWAIPYEKQPMYSFYEKSAEEVAKEPIIRLPEEKRKVTMTASFHLTRHPATGTDVLKGKIPPAGGVKAYAADTWLDKEHLGMKDPTLRPGDADLQETIKKKAAKAEPLAEFEDAGDATPEPGGGVRPTSAASAVSDASDASSSKKKRKGKKKGKDEHQSSTEQSASADNASATSKMEAEASNTKTDSMTEGDAESEAGGKKEKHKKKGKKKTGSGDGAEEMGQTAESFHSVASATSAASGQTALTDDSEADSPKAKKKAKAKPSAKKEAQSTAKLEIPKEGAQGSESPGGSRKTSDVAASAEDTEVVVVPGKGSSSPKPTDSARSSPKKNRSRSPRPEGPDIGGKKIQNLDGLGDNFATMFCWAGMYGGMSGTGLRPKWKDNPRLPALVGKQSTDDLHTPCYVRHAYRVGTVAVGPPYQMREKLDAQSPHWTAVKVLDASIEKADWVRSYSKILKEHSRKLGPAQGIREMNRTVSLPKVGASRPKPRPVLRARSAEGKKERRKSPGTDGPAPRGTEVSDHIDTTIVPDNKKKDSKEDKKKDKDKKKKDKKDKKGDEDEDGKKKKKDKKKKDKKEKQSEAQDEPEEAEPESVEVWQESFETMPSVGTWLMAFTEEMMRPMTHPQRSVGTPSSVAESYYSATFGAEAAMADALLSAAFGELTPEAVEEMTEEIIAEQADEDTRPSTMQTARAAVRYTLEQAAIILAQKEADQSSNVECARVAVLMAMRRAAEILQSKDQEVEDLVPERLPSAELVVHPVPAAVEELIEDQPMVPEVEESEEESEVETEPEVRLPVKRTPFTNTGATRREVSNFALSLTSSIFRASRLPPGQRNASRSRSPMKVPVPSGPSQAREAPTPSAPSEPAAPATEAPTPSEPSEPAAPATEVNKGSAPSDPTAEGATEAAPSAPSEPAAAATEAPAPSAPSEPSAAAAAPASSSFEPPERRNPGRQSPPPLPPPTEPSPRMDPQGPKPKLTALPANEGERF